MKKLVVMSLISALVLSTNTYAYGLFDVDIDEKLKYNNSLIKKYENKIKALKEENKYIMDEKAKNPKLYEKKPLYESLKDKYIHRIKLNGASADKLNFMIKDNMVSIVMDMKSEEKNENGYFYNSRHFSTAYTIPKDVEQDKIIHKTEGDYFVVEMPKKR
jgi:HSP20 family molecular chaperone IbpA